MADLSALRNPLHKLASISDERARWRPDGALISLFGIVNHLAHVEWRWIDGGILDHSTQRTDAEFSPGPELTVSAAVETYRQRAVATNAVIRTAALLSVPCSTQPGTDLWCVVLHLMNETVRHAGHADAVRELLDGTTGE